MLKDSLELLFTMGFCPGVDEGGLASRKRMRRLEAERRRRKAGCGLEQVAAKLEASELMPFGEAALINNAPRNASVVALEEMTCTPALWIFRVSSTIFKTSCTVSASSTAIFFQSPFQGGLEKK